MSDRKWDIELVDDLTELANPDSPNRAALAHLRRGLDRPLDYTLGRVGWLFRRVPDFALALPTPSSPPECSPGSRAPARKPRSVNFGVAFGAGLTLEEKQQREKRFIDLLDTDSEELRYKLRQAITLIARDGTGLDWRLLIQHLELLEPS